MPVGQHFVASERLGGGYKSRKGRGGPFGSRNVASLTCPAGGLSAPQPGATPTLIILGDLGNAAEGGSWIRS